MNINDSVNSKKALGLDKALTEKTAEAKKSTNVQNAPNSATAKSSGNVTLSPLSVQLQSLESAVSASEVFDSDKVDAIKSAIANGQFKVDSEKVADGLIQTVKDLLKAKNG